MTTLAAGTRVESFPKGRNSRLIKKMHLLAWPVLGWDLVLLSVTVTT